MTVRWELHYVTVPVCYLLGEDKSVNLFDEKGHALERCPALSQGLAFPQIAHKQVESSHQGLERLSAIRHHSCHVSRTQRAVHPAFNVRGLEGAFRIGCSTASAQPLLGPLSAPPPERS